MGWLLAGLFAIPFGSVTAVALAADVASTTDPQAAAIGVPALFAGVVFGVMLRRAVRAVYCGLEAVSAALVRVLEQPLGPAPTPELRFSFVPSPVPAPAFVPSATGRRGPPSSRR